MIQNKKKILIICKGHKNVAGAQLYLKQICMLFNPVEYEVHFAYHKEDGDRFYNEIAEYCDVFFWEYDWRHIKPWQSFKKGYSLIKKIKPEIVIFNSSEDEIMGTIWAARVCRVPKRVMVVHWALSSSSLPLFVRKKGFPLPIPSRYSMRTRIVRSLCYHFLNNIVFVNQITRNAYIELYKLSPDKCITIYNGIDIEKYEASSDLKIKIRSELGLNSGDCMVLATGNLTEVKGHKYLISAMRKLVDDFSHVKCFIAGQGELKIELENQIHELGLTDHVILLGYRNDVARLLIASDMFCMPSLNEALGYSLLEASAAGVPIVASDVGGIPEVIEHNITGLLVKPCDAVLLYQSLKKIWENPELGRCLVENGKKHIIETFSIDRMLYCTESIFCDEDEKKQ